MKRVRFGAFRDARSVCSWLCVGVGLASAGCGGDAIHELLRREVSVVGGGPLGENEGKTLVVQTDVELREAVDLLLEVSGTATTVEDYEPLPASIHIAAGRRTAELRVTAVPDEIAEADETISIRLRGTGDISVPESPAVFIITDDDGGIGGRIVSIDDAVASEADGALVFTVRMSGASAVDAQVTYETSPVTAADGSDYTAVADTLFFPAGQTVATISVPVIDDTVAEPDETLIVTLTSAAGLTLGDAEATGTITADGEPGGADEPSLSIADTSASEADGFATVVLTLSNPSGLDVTVDWATADVSAIAGVDYTASSGTVIFPAGETTQSVSIPIIDDALAEPNETLVVDLTGESGAILVDAQAEVTLLADNGPGGGDDPIVSISDASSDETTGVLTFDVDLSNASALTVEVSFGTSDESAVDGLDYVGTGGLLTFAPGETHTTVSVTVIDDPIAEPDESLLVSLANAVNATVGAGQGRGTIAADGGPSGDVPGLVVNGITVDEANATVSLNVTLSAASAFTVTVDWATSDGGATAGADYTSASGGLTFAPGETSQTVSIDILDDGLGEGDEDVLVTLANAVNAIIATGTGAVTIRGDSTTPGGGDQPSFSIDDVTVQEGDGVATFTVTLSNASAQVVTVDYATAGNTATLTDDFAALSTTLTFAPSQLSATIDVPIVDDDIAEGDETYFVNLTSPANATIADPQGQGTIQGGDAATLSISGPTAVESAGVAQFTVTLSNPSATTVTVDFATADGTASAPGDYTAASGTVTFTPGVTSQPIDVAVVDDTVAEPDETLTVTLSSPSGASLSATFQATGTILGGDTPSVTIGDVTVPESAGTAQLAVTLSNASTSTVTVSYATSDGTALAPADYTAASSLVTFAPGVTSQLIDVTIVDDATAEADETFTVTLSSPSGAVLGTTFAATGTIQGDPPGGGDTPTLSVADGSGSEAAGVQLVVTLSNPSASTVTVSFATVGGSAVEGTDYTGTSGVVTFLPGDVSEPIDVAVTDDNLGEGAETFVVNLSGPSGATLLDGQGTGTIAVSDTPSISIAGATVLETVGTTQLTVTLSNAADADVTVSYATSDASATEPSDYQQASGTVTLTAGSVTQSIDLTIVDDVVAEADESFTVTLSSPSANATLGGGFQASVTISGDDSTPGGGDRPTLSIADGTGTEASGVVQLIVTLSNASAQTVTVGYASTGMLATEGADYTAAAGTVTFLPGDVSEPIDVVVTDDSRGEVDEDFVIDLSGATNADILVGQATGTISANDTPAISIDDVSLNEANGPAVFTVSLSNASDLTVTVTATTADGTAVVLTDYTSATSLLSFVPGDTSEPFVVSLIDNGTDEDDETFVVDLTGEANATVLDGQGTGTIVNDDPDPTVGFSVASQTGTETSGSSSILVELSVASDLTVTVPYSVNAASTASAGDYSFAPSTPPSPLTFLPGETSKTLTVTLVNDGVADAGETVVLDLGAATNASLGTATHTLTILDADTPLTVTSAQTMDVDGNGLIDHYKLTFSKAVNDASFPGYVTDDFGTAQTDWLVAGAFDVALEHGAVAPELDTVNDAVLYVGFTEDSSLGSGATPDLTSSVTPGVVAVSGTTCDTILTGTVTESDGAPPVILRATSETGLNVVNVIFSEPVRALGETCPTSALDVQGVDLSYVDVSGSGAGALTNAGDLSGCDGKIAPATNATVVAGDVLTDTVGAVAGRVLDVTGNVMSATQKTLTAVVHPYVLSATSVDGFTARIRYSEGVNNGAATTTSNYTLADTTCGGSPTLGAVTKIADDLYQLATSAQTSGCTYKLEVTGAVQDLDESALMTDPKFATFIGQQQLIVLSAEAESLKSFVITFSKDVLASGVGGASNVSYYTLPAALGPVVSAVRYDTVTGNAADRNKVRVRHTNDQGSSFYSVVVSTALLRFDGGESLAPNPYDRTSFLGLGGNITSISQGPVFTDPFGDGTSFAFVFTHQGKIYAGPNDADSAVFRFDPDGTNAVTVTFRINTSVPSVVTSFANQTYSNGVNAFVTANVNGEDYLVFGVQAGSAQYTDLYFTRDTDTVLDIQRCQIQSVTLGNTESLQTIFGLGPRLYFGFGSSSSSGKPLMGVLDLNAGVCGTLSNAVKEPLNGGKDEAHYLNHLGGAGERSSSSPPSETNVSNAGHPVTGAVGIDSFASYGSRLFAANNGGIISTANVPLDNTSVWTPHVWDGSTWTSGTTKPIPNIGRLRPGEKGVPIMTSWGGFLFVARNRSDNVAEVWKYNGTTWTRVVLTSDATNGMNPNNYAVSMIAVNGPYLYIGFDNDTNGAEVWRTNSGVTASTFAGHASLQKIGFSGFGPLGAADLTKNKQIISHTSASFAGKNYLYITVGCTSDMTDDGACDRKSPLLGSTDFSIRMFRQVD